MAVECKVYNLKRRRLLRFRHLNNSNRFKPLWPFRKSTPLSFFVRPAFIALITFAVCFFLFLYISDIGQLVSVIYLRALSRTATHKRSLAICSLINYDIKLKLSAVSPIKEC